jgi:hypothetical protein
LLHAIRTSQLEGFEELRDLVERKGRDYVTVVRDSHTLIVEKLAALEPGIQTVGRSVQSVDKGVGRVDQGIGRVETRQLSDIEQRRVNDLLQRNCVDDVRLFDVTCNGRSQELQHIDQKTYEHNRDSLNPTHRLIHDLCVKADGNLLWVTVVLDTVYERLADGQSVTEVMR